MEPKQTLDTYVGRMSHTTTAAAEPNTSTNYTNISNSHSDSSNSPAITPNKCSALSSLTSSSTTSSEPQYSEDVRRGVRASTTTTSTTASKIREVDFSAEERDTFSPVRSKPSSPLMQCNGAGTSAADDNKLFAGPEITHKKHKLLTNGGAVGGGSNIASSKEEKERQNEEIVYIETSSSLSSASVEANVNSASKDKPPLTATDLLLPYARERSYSANAASNSCEYPKRELLQQQQEMSNSGTSACFIDASTLRDDDEIQLVASFPSLVLASSSAPTAQIEQLEDFHKAFAKCKSKAVSMHSMKTINSNASTSSSSSAASGLDSPQKQCQQCSDATSNNLSDEEKLWKRQKVVTSEPAAAPVNDVDSSDSSASFSVRRGVQPPTSAPKPVSHQLVHFTIQPLSASPKFSFLPNVSAAQTSQAAGQNHAHSDLSYTTDYSSSSPAPSLVWSEYEQRSVGGGANAGFRQVQHVPETPHNSIMHIELVSSNASSIHRDSTLSSSLSQQRDSGAYCSDATDSPVPLPRTPKRTRYDEENPIIKCGGETKRQHAGFSSLDFQTTRPMNDDDADRALIPDDDSVSVELRVKKQMRKPTPTLSAWVVDMTDCRRQKHEDGVGSTSSLDALPLRFRERSDSGSSHKSGCGFYVPLDELPAKQRSLDEQRKPQMSKSCTSAHKAAQGFFVPLAQSEAEQAAVVSDSEKKPIFSMFIDFGEPRKTREPLSLAQRLTSSLTSAQRRSSSEEPGVLSSKSSTSSTETLMAKSASQKASAQEEETTKSLEYRCNLEPPLRLRAQPQRAANDARKRHSWNTSGGSATYKPTDDCKRSVSLMANTQDADAPKESLMSIVDKLPIITKTSSLSLDSSISPYGSKSGLSTNSGDSARNSMDEPEALKSQTRIKKRRRDAQINETFDKSSVASLTDGVLSPCSATDTEDLTFQQDEELAKLVEPSVPVTAAPLLSLSNRSSAIVMETIIETKETSSPKKSAAAAAVGGHTMESLNATIEKQRLLLETVTEHVAIGNKTSAFVKLSDMDNPIKHELHSPDSMSKSAGNHRPLQQRLFRDDSKTRPHSWSMTRSTGNSLMNITSSVENMRSLSRIFPNFSKEFSHSLPNDIIVATQPAEEGSADSSLASSISRSGMDESSISCRQPRRLGEDLLKMFLQEIATDMLVEVHGRRIRAHKCILRSRCQYFAAMLAGAGTQSVVSLQGYSYPAVHFALCHIYSGASHPPDGISLMELAALADLLGLEGLKEVTSHALRMNYCHNFHKPCSGCIDGILQVLPVALTHSLDDLYQKCLRWVCRYYLKFWPTRQFAQLTSDIQKRCLQQIIAYMTSESVLDTLLECENLLDQLATYRWGYVCEKLVRELLDATYVYIADHFASLIASDAFLSLGHNRSRHIPRLEEILLSTATSLTPDQACRSYQRITRLNTVMQAKVIQMPDNLSEFARELQTLQGEVFDWDPDYIRLVSALLSAVEQCLIRQCARAMRVVAWQRMDLDLRKKIQTLARLTEPLDLKRNTKVAPKTYSFGGSSRSHELMQVKLAIQAHTRRTLEQDTKLYKATQTYGAVQTTECGVQANHDVREINSKILKSNSRAYVPRLARQSAAVPAERAASGSSLQHRRTQSEAPRPKVPTTAADLKTSTSLSSAQKSNGGRPPEVRPRYMEPRKTRVSATAGPVRSVTSSSIPATHNRTKGLQISSSDSSRNSSPAVRRNVPQSATKIGTKSSNLSIDNLSSPARHTKSAPRNKSIDGDSESMKSSMFTNKTMSRESLASNRTVNRQTPMRTAVNSSATKTTATNGLQPKAVNKSTRHLRQQNLTSTGSSPSSIQTVKSVTSRLSSVSSSHSVAARETYKHRSISVPANHDEQSSNQPRSFLSAKSREILAKRAEKNKLQQLQLKQQGISNSCDAPRLPLRSAPQRSSSHSAVATMMQQYQLRSSLPSNIPTRRPNTLHLRKTTSTAAKMASTYNSEHEPERARSKPPLTKQAHTQAQGKTTTAAAVMETSPPVFAESKLERSSTFCKEHADFDPTMHDLHILE